QRVTQAVIQGSGSSTSTGGLGTYTYSYSTSANPASYNSWTYKTVETLPDSTSNTVYANYAGEVMLKAYQSGGGMRETFYEYDSSCEHILKAKPSALTGYNQDSPDLLDAVPATGDYDYLSTRTGLIELTDSGTTTTADEGVAGDVSGYYK